jgi:hypothetical protein
MSQRTVSLPGPIYLVPSRDLGSSWDRKRRDHPHLPANLDQVQADFSAMHAEGGVPATIEASMERGRDQSLLIYGRTYVLRLFLLKRKRDGYRVVSINGSPTTIASLRDVCSCDRRGGCRRSNSGSFRQVPAATGR